MNVHGWKLLELSLLVLYALSFYIVIINRSLKLSHEHVTGIDFRRLVGLREGWIWHRLNDLSDAQWRNFRGNLAILTVVFGFFTLMANTLRSKFHLQGRGMSIVWLLLSLSYLSYLHGFCIIFVLLIASGNFFLVKIFAHSVYFSSVIWIFNLWILFCNRIYEGYLFSSIGKSWAFLDNYRGTFRWHICFNFVILRMISFGYDYHWANKGSRIDLKKHVQQCGICSSGNTCYLLLQERAVHINKFSFEMYLCYLVYAPLYIAGPIVSFNAFASQLDSPKRNHSFAQVAWYGFRWVLCLFLMESMTHFFYYNSFAISGLWKQLSPLEVFIIGYGVLNFMWLKFLLIWRYFRFWGLVGGIEAPENMPRCINNCYNLESFWKYWHASFNKWLIRYMYIPLGGSRTKLLNVWVIFTFVAVWHDLEWKLVSWAWLTCLFFIPELLMKSAATAIQAKNALASFFIRELSAVGGAITITCLMAKNALASFFIRELSAVGGAITITCLMIVNLVGYVIGPSGMDWLVSRLLQKDGLPVLGGIFTTFYVGTKLMFHIRDAKKK